jgi:hypothetical protein
LCESGGFQYTAKGGTEARSLVQTMGKCFDLRALCSQPCPLLDRVEALRTIHSAAAKSDVELPSLETLEAQLETLRECMSSLAKQPRYRSCWFDKNGNIRSGTVIMKSLFTCKELYAGMGDVLRTSMRE